MRLYKTKLTRFWIRSLIKKNYERTTKFTCRPDVWWRDNFRTAYCHFCKLGFWSQDQDWDHTVLLRPTKGRDPEVKRNVHFFLFRLWSTTVSRVLVTEQSRSVCIYPSCLHGSKGLRSQYSCTTGLWSRRIPFWRYWHLQSIWQVNRL